MGSLNDDICIKIDTDCETSLEKKGKNIKLPHWFDYGIKYIAKQQAYYTYRIIVYTSHTTCLNLWLLAIHYEYLMIFLVSELGGCLSVASYFAHLQYTHTTSLTESSTEKNNQNQQRNFSPSSCANFLWLYKSQFGMCVCVFSHIY